MKINSTISVIAGVILGLLLNDKSPWLTGLFLGTVFGVVVAVINSNNAASKNIKEKTSESISSQTSTTLVADEKRAPPPEEFGSLMFDILTESVGKWTPDKEAEFLGKNRLSQSAYQQNTFIYKSLLIALAGIGLERAIELRSLHAPEESKLLMAGYIRRWQNLLNADEPASSWAKKFLTLRERFPHAPSLENKAIQDAVASFVEDISGEIVDLLMLTQLLQINFETHLETGINAVNQRPSLRW